MKRALRAIGSGRRRLYAAVYARFDRGLRRRTAEVRRRLIGDLTGDVLEIGVGTGANLEHYREGARVVATDYNEHMLRRARADAERAQGAVELRSADAGALPFEDARFDAVVSTLVLCSVPEQARTLAEVRRVLKPGGALRLLEHVRSDRPWALALQRTVNPAWGLVADGCHLDRDTLAAVRRAGFEVETVEEARVDPLLKNLLIFARKPSD